VLVRLRVVAAPHELLIDIVEETVEEHRRCSPVLPDADRQPGLRATFGRLSRRRVQELLEDPSLEPAAPVRAG
jgi:hypothetical protein